MLGGGVLPGMRAKEAEQEQEQEREKQSEKERDTRTANAFSTLINIPSTLALIIVTVQRNNYRAAAKLNQGLRIYQKHEAE